MGVELKKNAGTCHLLVFFDQKMHCLLVNSNHGPRHRSLQPLQALVPTSHGLFQALASGRGAAELCLQMLDLRVVQCLETFHMDMDLRHNVASF